jgi:hypothetical protein
MAWREPAGDHVRLGAGPVRTREVEVQDRLATQARHNVRSVAAHNRGNLLPEEKRYNQITVKERILRITKRRITSVACDEELSRRARATLHDGGGEVRAAEL